MIAPKESKNLKKNYKRLAWFIAGVFVFAVIECALLSLTGISAVLNGFILIISVSVLYLIFLLICAKIDKKKDARLKERKGRDPFAH